MNIKNRFLKTIYYDSMTSQLQASSDRNCIVINTMVFNFYGTVLKIY